MLLSRRDPAGRWWIALAIDACHNNSGRLPADGWGCLKGGAEQLWSSPVLFGPQAKWASIPRPVPPLSACLPACLALTRASRPAEHRCNTIAVLTAALLLVTGADPWAWARWYLHGGESHGHRRRQRQRCRAPAAHRVCHARLLYPRKHAERSQQEHGCLHEQCVRVRTLLRCQVRRTVELPGPPHPSTAVVSALWAWIR